MDKKLPKLYANKIEKPIENNENVFYSAMSTSGSEDSKERSAKDPTPLTGQNINQKINSIFTSPRYVYKADVDITLKDGKVSKRVVGKNGTHLITIDNELIAISDILDIDFSK